MNEELDLNPNPSGISEKDIKILWGRAAEKCAICRKDLTLNTTSNVSTTGHMCHIVGEKNNEKSPRGLSNLTTSERNSYPNLILLCRNHHAEIDLDVNKFSIEKLHDIKSNHEIWVKETLGEKPELPHDIIYVDLIDFLNSNLRLSEWPWFSEHAVRQLLHYDFILSCDNIVAKNMTIIWPEENLDLEQSFSNVMASYIAYISQYLELAEPKDGKMEIYSPPGTYRTIKDIDERWYETERESLWARKNLTLLCQYTIHLNEFVQKVRQYYNPYFYLTRGKFILNDALGTHNGGEPALIDPTKSFVEYNLEVIGIDEGILKKKKPIQIHNLKSSFTSDQAWNIFTTFYDPQLQWSIERMNMTEFEAKKDEIKTRPNVSVFQMDGPILVTFQKELAERYQNIIEVTPRDNYDLVLHNHLVVYSSGKS